MGSGALPPPAAAASSASSPLLASFRDSYRDLLRYLAHRTGSADEARDVAHDTWLRLADMDLRGEQPALCEGEARAYVFAMARNLVTDRQRHAGVVTRHARGAEATAAVPSALQHGPDECEALMYRQAVVALEAALATVPDRARQIFLRHRVNGEGQGALAAEYGISRNMVERDMMLAMDRVQSAMERWHAGNGGDAATPPRVGRRRSLAALLGVAGMGLGGLLAWRGWQLAVPEWQQVAATGHGQTLRQPLPDGGSITLDAQTRLQVGYYAARRSVRLLAGAAFFDVAHDAGRPFVVEVPGGAAAADGSTRITVLGTRFGVERAASGAVEVQVESGRVRVQLIDAQGQELAVHELVADQAQRARPGEPLPPVHRPAQATSTWRQGVVVFADTPLADAVERLRRYLPRPVQVADERAALLRLSGQVRIAQAEDFVRALPGVVPVQVRLAAGQWRIAAR